MPIAVRRTAAGIAATIVGAGLALGGALSVAASPDGTDYNLMGYAWEHPNNIYYCFDDRTTQYTQAYPDYGNYRADAEAAVRWWNDSFDQLNFVETLPNGENGTICNIILQEDEQIAAGRIGQGGCVSTYGRGWALPGGRNPDWIYYCAQHQGGYVQMAFNRMMYQDSTGRYQPYGDAAIIFNLAHEIGHALGLDHSCALDSQGHNDAAIMDVGIAPLDGRCGTMASFYGCYTDGTGCPSGLLQDDVNGINWLYPYSSDQTGSCAGATIGANAQPATAASASQVQAGPPPVGDPALPVPAADPIGTPWGPEGIPAITEPAINLWTSPNVIGKAC